MFQKNSSRFVHVHAGNRMTGVIRTHLGIAHLGIEGVA
jgi:hypothetical protein